MDVHSLSVLRKIICGSGLEMNLEEISFFINIIQL